MRNVEEDGLSVCGVVSSAAMGTALNSTATLWVIIFGALLFNAEITLSIVLWGFVIVAGVFIFAIQPKSKGDSSLDENLETLAE